MKSLKDAWPLPDGLWDAWCSADPDPTDDTLTKEGLTEIFDAEGNTICYAPLVGPDGQANWPEMLAEFLNAATEEAEDCRLAAFMDSHPPGSATVTNERA